MATLQAVTSRMPMSGDSGYPKIKLDAALQHHTLNTMPLTRTLEPEVMDTVEEAIDYDSMDHSTVNRLFVLDLLRFVASSNEPSYGAQSTDHADFESGKTNANEGHLAKVNALDRRTVIDVGTGTALIPVELASIAQGIGAILAIDLSIEMLRLASRHLRRKELSHQILPVFTDAKRLPLANGSCDVVVSNSIVHHIPNPLDVFVEFRRVISSGGVLFVRDLMRPTSGEIVDQIVTEYAGDENANQQQLFRQSLHAALTVEEVREMLDEADLGDAAVVATSDRHWTISGRF